MTLFIGFLTFILVVNCLFLALLVLIQLPKKEAGAGVAFGGSATDALFGAGTGNALTKATRYAATIFVGLAIVLSILYTRQATATGRRLEQEIQKQATTPPPVQIPAVTNALTPAQAPMVTVTNVSALATSQTATTNPPAGTASQTATPATATTNAPATPVAPQTPAPTPQ